MIPVISIVGWHDVGKTTFAERLIRALKERGYRVGAIKHSQGHFDLDHEGTDTFRYAAAGSDAVGIAGRGRLALMLTSGTAEGLAAQLSCLPSDLDLVIAEGYKRESTPKFEVVPTSGEGDRIAPDVQLLAEVANPEGAPGGGKQAQTSEGDDALRLAIDDVPAAIELLCRRGFLVER